MYPREAAHLLIMFVLVVPIRWMQWRCLHCGAAVPQEQEAKAGWYVALQVREVKAGWYVALQAEL